MAEPGASFDPARDIPSLQGKVILITGANSGIGKQSALELSKHNPAQLWLACRDRIKGQATVEDVKQHASPGTEVLFLEIDTSYFESVRTAAKAFLDSARRLDLLVLNAGIMGCPPAVSKDGYEIQFATNHLGHALLLKLLAPLLTKTATGPPEGDVRVVSLSSSAYKHTTAKTIQFDTLKDPEQILDPKVVTPVERYCQSKLANLLYAREASKRFPQGIKVVSLNPGNVRTDLFTREPGDEQMRMLQTTVVPMQCGSVEEGVKNPLWAMTAKEGVGNGNFYDPVGKAVLEEGPAHDEDLANRLWEWTDKELQGQVI